MLPKCSFSGAEEGQSAHSAGALPSASALNAQCAPICKANWQSAYMPCKKTHLSSLPMSAPRSRVITHRGHGMYFGGQPAEGSYGSFDTVAPPEIE
jgi:hypothetical protein